jgi:hypothetical protein
MDMIDQYDRSLTMKATTPSPTSLANLGTFLRNIDTDSEPLMKATEAAPLIDQILTRGTAEVVTSPLDGRRIGHVITLGNWTLFLASSLIPAGSTICLTSDLRITVRAKSIRQFTAVLIRNGQDRPAYAGTDFTFRNLR